MKLTFNLLFLIGLISSCGSSCNKDKPKDEEVFFEFEIPLTITPGKDTISLSEELLLSANFPDTLKDYISQKYYGLPNFNFQTVAVVRKLVNPSLGYLQQQSAVSDFDYINTIGAFSNFSSTYIDVNYVYNNNRYQIGIKLKPRQKGVYTLRFYHSTGTRGYTDVPVDLGQTSSGGTYHPKMSVIRYSFNNGNTHLNIYENNCLNQITEPSQKQLLNNSTYTFVVK